MPSSLQYLRIHHAVSTHGGDLLCFFSVAFQVARAAAEQALSWTENDDTGATKGGLKIVVVENMFRPADFEVIN